MPNTITVLDHEGTPVEVSTLDLIAALLGATNVAIADAGGEGSVSGKLRRITSQLNTARGAGAIDSTTQRVALASDSPGVTTLGQATMANSLPVAIASNQPGIPAALDSASIYNGATAMTPKFAAIAASSSGNNTLVSAVTSKKIRVLALSLMGNGAVNAKFQSGAGGTDLTGLHYIDAAGGGFVLPFNPAGWFETAATTLLNLNLSGAVAVGGCLTYVEV